MLNGVQQISDEYIRTEAMPACYLCGARGEPLYDGLRDRLYGCPGEWGFLRCRSCGLVWLSPRPVAAEIHKAYMSYHTHASREAQPLFGYLRTRFWELVLGAACG